VIAGREPQRLGASLVGEDDIGLRAGLCNEFHAGLERVLARVSLRGLVEAAWIGEAAQVANLEEASESDTMLARPRLRQLERGQDAATKVTEDEIGC
jgi:hypothetical protein